MIGNIPQERHMTGFRFEREMSERTRKWLVAEGLTVKSEFAVPWGVCDFVGVEFDPKRVAHRLRLGQTKSIGSALRVDLLRHIPDQDTGSSISLSGLSKLYDGWLHTDRLVAELQKLKASKFIICDGNLRRFQKINGWAPIHRRVVALELKSVARRTSVGTGARKSGLCDRVLGRDARQRCYSNCISTSACEFIPSIGHRALGY